MLYKTKQILIILSALYFYLCLNNASAAELYKISNEPLNRLCIYFDNLPQQFKSILSPSKKQIIIEVPNASAAQGMKNFKFSGIISEAVVFKAGDVLTISININEKRGYNAVLLPFSKAIMVDVFRWDNLSTAEDSYRSGLLAYESGIFSTAKKELAIAAKANNPDAAAFLGIINYSEGNFDYALSNLLAAEKLNTSIADAYAALSLLFSKRSDAAKAAHYKAIFQKKTGLTSFDEGFIVKNSVVEIPLDSASLLYKMSYNVVIDSNQTSKNLVDTQRAVPLKNDSLIVDTIGAKTEAKSGGSVLSDTAFYGTVVLLLLIITILSAYLRWKKQVIKQMAKRPPIKSQFTEDLKDAQSTAAKRAMANRLYKQQAEANSQPVKKENLPQDETFSDKNVLYNIKSAQNLQNKDIESKLAVIAQKIMESKKAAESGKSKIFETKPEHNSYSEKEPKKPLSPKVELAMHLQKEQLKIKDRKISSLRSDDMPDDETQLSELSRKTGIEKSGLEIKKNIDVISSDAQKLEQIKEKFKTEDKNKG